MAGGFEWWVCHERRWKEGKLSNMCLFGAMTLLKVNFGNFFFFQPVPFFSMLWVQLTNGDDSFWNWSVLSMATTASGCKMGWNVLPVGNWNKTPEINPLFTVRGRANIRVAGSGNSLHRICSHVMQWFKGYFDQITVSIFGTVERWTKMFLLIFILSLCVSRPWHILSRL